VHERVRAGHDLGEAKHPHLADAAMQLNELDNLQLVGDESVSERFCG